MLFAGPICMCVCYAMICKCNPYASLKNCMLHERLRMYVRRFCSVVAYGCPNRSRHSVQYAHHYHSALSPSKA